MTNDLEVWRGLDFSSYQLGDVIIISLEDMNKQFAYGSIGWREFRQKIEYIAVRLHLFDYVEFDNDTAEVRIYLLENRPENHTPERPDPAISMARRRVWKRNLHVHADGMVGGFEDDKPTSERD